MEPLMYIQAVPADTTTASTPYDSVWAGTEEVPVKEPVGLERVMLQQDKIYVVLGVVLLIWIGLAYLLLRNDRRLKRLEEQLQAPD
ncbi:MAG: CcmD family protein [Bacteroidota bacterium]